MSEGVVRCRNCKHREDGSIFMRKEWGFCSHIVSEHKAALSMGDDDICVHDDFGCVIGEAVEGMEE